MYLARYWCAALIALLLPGFSQPIAAQLTGSKIIIRELIVEGTRSLDNAELNEITNSLIETKSGDSSAEVSDRLRDAFGQRGYFDAKVKHIKVKALDPLGAPKPVRVEAEVEEGPHYRIGGISFEGSRAFEDTQLRSTVPFRPGDFFDVGKVRSAVESLWKLYHSAGYLDFRPIPKTEKSREDLMSLTFLIEEGPQYRMGALDIRGEKDIADELNPRWELKPGMPFDEGYVDNFSKPIKRVFLRTCRKLRMSMSCETAVIRP